MRRKFLSLDDFEAAARRYLPRPIFAYISGGAEDNASLRDNRAAFSELGFVTGVLRNVSGRSQSVELLGRTYASPFGVAPMGISALSAYRPIHGSRRTFPARATRSKPSSRASIARA
jgi:L-lactate dehydrogenase (cytochrome)